MFPSKVYELVKQIPAGKVLTYGMIAQKLGKPGWARQVGSVLAQNRDPKIPCHRVVDKNLSYAQNLDSSDARIRNGRLAPNFAFGGWRKQRRRLLAEGVKFKDNMHVDLPR